jgi:type III secretion system YscQ/HrcQ family protein
MPVRVVDRPAVPDAAIRLDLQLAALAATGARARASLQCLPATLPRLMHWWTLRSGRPALRSDLPVEVRVHIGSAALTLSDLQGLAAGDLILPDRLPLEAGRWQTRLLAGAERRPWARGYIEGELVVITETEPSNAPPATAAPTLPPLTVDIAFEIGARRLPLAELTRIAPGYIFDLGAQADGEIVDLVANGQRIGRGHLVLLGEALGVRVSQVDLHAHGEGQSAGSPAPGTP